MYIGRSLKAYDKSIGFIYGNRLYASETSRESSRSVPLPPNLPSHATYYQILNVSRNATAKEIKHAFYDLSRKYHPDQNKESGPFFVRVNEAYSHLKDDKKRAAYDRSIGGRGSTYHSSNSFYKKFGGASGGNFYRPPSSPSTSSRKTNPMGTPPSYDSRYTGTSSTYTHTEFTSSNTDANNAHFNYDTHYAWHSRRRNTKTQNGYNEKQSNTNTDPQNQPFESGGDSFKSNHNEWARTALTSALLVLFVGFIVRIREEMG